MSGLNGARRVYDVVMPSLGGVARCWRGKFVHGSPVRLQAQHAPSTGPARRSRRQSKINYPAPAKSTTSVDASCRIFQCTSCSTSSSVPGSALPLEHHCHPARRRLCRPLCCALGRGWRAIGHLGPGGGSGGPCSCSPQPCTRRPGRCPTFGSWLAHTAPHSASHAKALPQARLVAVPGCTWSSPPEVGRAAP